MSRAPYIAAGLLWLAAGAFPAVVSAHNSHEHHEEPEHHNEHDHTDDHEHEHEHEHEHHNDGYRSHDAHVHGLAQLTLALEGNLLGIHFISPAANILGFEHRARTDAEQQHVAAAEASLQEPASLFAFRGTRCNATDAAVDVSSVSRSAGSPTSQSAPGESHNDIEGHYQFVCEQGQQLEAVTVELVQHFTGIERLNVQWVTDTSQGAQVLTRQAATLTLD